MRQGTVVWIACTLLMTTAAIAAPYARAASKAFFVAPRINGYQEVPTRFSPAFGEFRAIVSADGGTIDYRLTYSGFPTPVREAHIHLGARGVNGGVMVFLCSNTGNAPPNTPSCPGTEGIVTGTLTAASVVGPVEQGIAPGELHKVLAAMRVRAGYVNIHTEQVPAGEIRDQAVPVFFDPDTNIQDPNRTPGTE